MSNWFWGATGRSFIDVWTLPHLAFWIFVGSVLWPLVKDAGLPLRLIALGACLIAAYGWEVFEKVAEVRWPGLWLHPESLANSLISDPLTTVVGVLGMMWMLDRWAR
jgi:hypothetical protein